MQARCAEVQLSEGDRRACRELLKNGSRSFYVASHLMPQPWRDSACALYAFCRVADDVIDEGDDPACALVGLNRRLDAIYRGAPEDAAVDRAMAVVVRRHQLPRELPGALLEGFAWDAQARSYANLSSVLDYAARVAGSVGAMMALVMGVRDPHALARAADLGVAMQLTNIARDVGEDARAGRLYLPRDWLREVGVDPLEFLREPRFSPELASVVRRLLEHAELLYRRADSGIAQLPRSCRAGIYAARLLYARIGHELLKRDCDSVSRRTVVAAGAKLGQVVRVPGMLLLDQAGLSQPALQETRYLVDSVMPIAESAGGTGIAWVLDLFEELERRDRSGRQAIL